MSCPFRIRPTLLRSHVFVPAETNALAVRPRTTLPTDSKCPRSHCTYSSGYRLDPIDGCMRRARRAADSSDHRRCAVRFRDACLILKGPVAVEARSRGLVDDVFLEPATAVFGPQLVGGGRVRKERHRLGRLTAHPCA